LPAHEPAVPAEEARRGDEEGDRAVTREDPTHRREEHSVDGPALPAARRPLQHAALMAEHADLEVLGPVVSTTSATADEQTDEGADDAGEERPPWSVVPERSKRESEFLLPTGCVPWTPSAGDARGSAQHFPDVLAQSGRTDRRRNQMPARVAAHPFLTLMAVISAILIVVGRVNRLHWWGNWVFVAGIAVLVVAGALYVVLTAR
jgi:hypothetical protein